MLLQDIHANRVVASYERPDHDFALVGVGVAGRVEVPAGDGPRAARAATQRLLGLPVHTDWPELRPRLLGGFAFNPSRPPSPPWAGFPAGLLVLPRLLFVRSQGVTGVVLAPGVDSGEAEALSSRAHPAARRPDLGYRLVREVDRDRLLSSVATVAAHVRAGHYEKAVLAGSRELAADWPFDLGAAVARLRTDYPHCHVFTQTVAGTTFLGASPELLVARLDGVVTSLGLAGSAPRGADAVEDERLGRELLADAKNRIEHDIVVRAIREGLSPLTSHLRAPNQPGLMRLPNIQHLSTHITAEADEGIDILTLVQRLHPTPAVCGWPTAEARRVIETHEGFDRGWWASPVGWVDAAGDGEFTVALRSALVRGERAWLFAGAGIMGDSRPADELAEIDLKMRPLANALAGCPA